ncbi:MAG: hypothetical protein KGN84_18325 [Acidobacteriota bacterium]|nr:hypothetical protein [Acidobacteriota bacterium]
MAKVTTALAEELQKESALEGAKFWSRTAPWMVAGFGVLMIVAFIALDRVAPADRRLVKIRGEDPVAYFGMAHSVLFDHDFDLSNEFRNVPPVARWWTANQPRTGLPGSPWGLGYSFLETPLLAVGSGLDAWSGGHGDGYGSAAVFCYCLGTVIFAGLGLVALFFLLKEAGAEWGLEDEERRSKYALLLTLATYWGTNVGFYSFSQMGHSATFLFSCLFLLVWWRIRERTALGRWFLLGLIGGMLSICRWQDVLELGIPLMYDLGGGNLAAAAREKWKSRLIYAAGAALWWIPQAAEFKAIYGSYVTVPQAGYFSFPPSHFWQVLFSTQSGWVAWTPLIGLGLAGLLWAAARRPRLYVPLLLVLTMQVVVVGSISFWDGIGSFSSRYLNSLTPMAAVGAMVLWRVTGRRARFGLTALGLIFCAFTTMFAIEYGLYLAPTTVRMTFSEYVTDKFRPFDLYRRKSAVRTANELLDQGKTGKAIDTLEGALRYGDDREVYQILETACRNAGRIEEADRFREKREEFLRGELF